MKSMTEPKNSSSFEVVLIDDHHSGSNNSRPVAPEVERTLLSNRHGWIYLSPRGRLQALACYLLISGLLSLYFCLVQAGMETIKLCGSVASCFLYSTQGWPALGEQSVDLLVVSYFSGGVSVLGGILGAFGLYASYKDLFCNQDAAQLSNKQKSALTFSSELNHELKN
ncbi:hypothetical protein EDD21DRAFT_368899 [Dissophora ornata]|nr:hypothetical protein EDD21DRAFT_368899 [Dissophora ornata]